MRNLLAVIVLIAILRSQAGGGVKEAFEALDRGDHATAIKEFSALADRGDDKAMITLGLMYQEGDGVPQDYGKAMEWYLKAFKKGNGDAYNNIGVMYRDGQGIQTNREIAYALFFIVHMRGLGGDETQLRAGRNLDKTASLMKPGETAEATKVTEKYVVTFVEKQGKLNDKEKALKFSRKHHAIQRLAEL